MTDSLGKEGVYLGCYGEKVKHDLKFNFQWIQYLVPGNNAGTKSQEDLRSLERNDSAVRNKVHSHGDGN